MSTAASTGGRLLSGVAWNALGRGLPLALALVVTPFLLHQLGLERWGLFTLALALVGVFNVFDFGIAPALMRSLAERIGAGETDEARSLVGSALTVLLGISAAIAVLLWALMPHLVRSVLKVPPALEPEAIAGFRILALAAPLVVLNSALWGVLAAFQRFRAANLVNIPVNAFYYIGPLLLLMVWDSFAGVMAMLAACRLGMTLAYAWLAHRDVPGLGLDRIRPRLALPLLRLGGWMTLTSVFTQALMYADRFVIGALLTLSAVAFYATPLDLVLRVWVLPMAVVQVLMPAIAGAYAARPAEAVAALRQGTLGILILVLPAAVLVTGASWDLLALWLGREFADGGASVLRILGIGIFFACVAMGPNSLLEGIGRPEMITRLVLAEAVVFLPLMVLLLHLFGIEGAAAAWALRSAVDCLGKAALAVWLYPRAAEALRTAVLPMLASAAGLLAMALPLGRPALAALGVLVLAVVTFLTWRAFAPEDRAAVLGRLRRLRGRAA